MAFTDTIITILILLLIAFIIYTKMKEQNLKDTLDELREIVRRE